MPLESSPMKTTLILSALLFAAIPSIAQTACPCVPISHLWTATTCDSWECVVSALNGGNGDPYLFPMSTGQPDHKWVILRRVPSGQAVEDVNDPYRVETFDGFNSAIARFVSIADDFRPMFTSAPDGKMLIVSLRDAAPPVKRRAAGR
jgi:hypothetical protein